MRRLLLLIPVLALALVFVLAPRSHAQTVQTGDCAPDVPNASDLAGVYFSAESAMRVTVFPCGVDILWSNASGTHRAEYAVSGRLESGALLARVHKPDPYVGTLDGRIGFSLAPAEPGWVTLLTIGPFGDHPRLYRLHKLS